LLVELERGQTRASLGYKTLYWYRDGVDAWQAANLPVTPAARAPELLRVVATP
jgi:hypothetical protein